MLLKNSGRPFCAAFANERVVAVVHQVQLGEYRQARVQQLADDARVGKGRGTHERRVKVPRCHRRRDALIRLDAQSPRFFPARRGEIHARQRRRRLHAPDEARTAFAHAAQTYDQKFHIISSPCRAVHSPLFNIGVSLPGANPAWTLLPTRRLGAFRLCPRRPCGKTGPNAQSQHHDQRPGENEDAPRALSPRENQQHKLHQQHRRKQRQRRAHHAQGCIQRAVPVSGTKVFSCPSAVSAVFHISRKESANPLIGCPPFPNPGTEPS